MNLTKIESVVYEAVKNGVQVKSANFSEDVNHHQFKRIMNKLIAHDAVTRVQKGRYVANVVEYTIQEPVPDKNEIVINTNVSPAVMKFIKKHYNKMRRTELARKAGVSKLALNKILIDSGIGS